MNLTEWHSNSLELLEKSMGTSLNTSQMTTGVTEEDKIYVKTVIRPKVSKLSQRLTKVRSYLELHGIPHLMCLPWIQWIDRVANFLLVNKRLILKLIAKIFDLLGFISSCYFKLFVSTSEIGWPIIRWAVDYVNGRTFYCKFATWIVSSTQMLFWWQFMYNKAAPWVFWCSWQNLCCCGTYTYNQCMAITVLYLY